MGLVLLCSLNMQRVLGRIMQRISALNMDLIVGLYYCKLILKFCSRLMS